MNMTLDQSDYRVHGQDVRLVVACMPKSGSTWLTRLISSLPGMRDVHLVPGFDRREQELCPVRVAVEVAETKAWRRHYHRDGKHMGQSWPVGFVAQMHLRHSVPTQAMADEFDLTFAVLVRNLTDVVVSMRDHLSNHGLAQPMAYVPASLLRESDEVVTAFVIDMIVPWYLNFLETWRAAGWATLGYDSLVQDPGAVASTAVSHAGWIYDESAVSAAVTATAQSFTRLNQGVAGRGRAELSESSLERLRELARPYPLIDPAVLGIL